MRSIGHTKTEAEAVVFSDYLFARQIAARIDRDEEGWVIWIYDEDQFQPAQAAFVRFQQDAEAVEFQEAAELAAELRKVKDREISQRFRQRRESAHQLSPGDPSTIPVTMVFIIACVTTTVAISMEDTQYGLRNDLSITQFMPFDLDRIRYNRHLPEVRTGEVWRLVTPVLIHFGPLHLLMNMWMVYQFGSILEPLLKSWRLLLMMLVIGAVSNLIQFQISGPSFGGLSGVICGLFGYTLAKSQFEPELGLHLSRDFVYFFVGFLVLCIFGIFGSIANGAHFGGLFCGVIIGSARPLMRKILRQLSP